MTATAALLVSNIFDKNTELSQRWLYYIYAPNRGFSR